VNDEGSSWRVEVPEVGEVTRLRAARRLRRTGRLSTVVLNIEKVPRRKFAVCAPSIARSVCVGGLGEVDSSGTEDTGVGEAT